ncbi:MAG: hypothetical protein ACKO96_16795, partial [Flammeovirgaceae bacterium]
AARVELSVLDTRGYFLLGQITARFTEIESRSDLLALIQQQRKGFQEGGTIALSGFKAEKSDRAVMVAFWPSLPEDLQTLRSSNIDILFQVTQTNNGDKLMSLKWDNRLLNNEMMKNLLTNLGNIIHNLT